LYLSTTAVISSGYTYELYTTIKGTNEKLAETHHDEMLAVGISQSEMLAVDRNAKSKAERECNFPLELVDVGIGFQSANGQVSIADFCYTDVAMYHSEHSSSLQIGLCPPDRVAP
jgi:hypothetical protein